MGVFKKKFGILCTLPGLVGVIAIIFYPTVYNIYVSFVRYDNIHPVVFNGVKNYSWLFSSKDFYVSLKVSTIYTVGSLVLTLAFGLILAHSLHVITKGRTVFRTLSILPWVVPLVISGFMWKWLLTQDIGVVNYVLISLRFISTRIGFLSDPNLAIISGTLASSFCQIPFMTILLLAGLESIPPDIYEAAKIDGADQLQRFWYISLPLNKYQMMIASLILLMTTFRTPDVFFSLTGGGPAKSTYHIGLFLFDTIFKYANFGHAGVIGVMLFVIVAGFSFPMLYYGIIRRSRS